MPAARPAHVRDPACAFARTFRSLLNRVMAGSYSALVLSYGGTLSNRRVFRIFM